MGTTSMRQECIDGERNHSGFVADSGEGQQQAKQRNGWDGVNKIDGSQYW